MISKKEFYVLRSLIAGNSGKASCQADLEQQSALKDPSILDTLICKEYVEKGNYHVTAKGMDAMSTYKVDNAVILAAGASTRFVPLSLEQPKGLFEVRGERLIEREIQQLKEAGINDITVVLGYKKEMFYYLEQKYSVKLVINEAFNVKNNIESLYLVKNDLKNTYICVSDAYYIENPFNAYEYESFLTGISVVTATNEMYVDITEDNVIAHMEKGRNRGYELLGHAFWQADFSYGFVSLMEEDRPIGAYSQKFWEWMVADHLNVLPALHFKEFADSNIHEFDFFEELRRFDSRYLSQTHSEIIRNIKLVFRCDEEDIVNFRRVNEGMTNTSFIFRIGETDYIYRHPGDGTESIISRKNEKTSLVLAKELGIDPTYIYEDINEGWKISAFVPKFREPEYSSFEDSRKVLEVLRKLHAATVKVDYGMKPWEDSVHMETLLREKDPLCFEPYEELKEKIRILYEKTLGDGVEKCFCHGDTYKPNWMLLPNGKVILIDWEYSGYSDPGIDVGYYVVDAMYDFDQAERFVKEYLQDTMTDKRFFHFMAYIAIIAYYWFVWAMYRESCGAVMGEALENWKQMAIRFADHLLS